MQDDIEIAESCIYISDNATNNVGEICALTLSMRLLVEYKHITKYTAVEFVCDSKYVIYAVENKAAWLRKSKLPNREHVMELYQAMSELEDAGFSIARMRWVKGHSDNVHNARCDIIARTAAEKGVGYTWLLE